MKMKEKDEKRDGKIIPVMIDNKNDLCLVTLNE